MVDLNSSKIIWITIIFIYGGLGGLTTSKYDNEQKYLLNFTFGGCLSIVGAGCSTIFFGTDSEFSMLTFGIAFSLSGSLFSKDELKNFILFILTKLILPKLTKGKYDDENNNPSRQ